MTPSPLSAGALVIAPVVLAAGAVLSLAFPRNRWRAGVAIATQLLACIVALPALVGVLESGSALTGIVRWSFPVEVITLRVDPLGAFFLVWSLPLILLATVYAVGYLEPYFAAGRNGGPAFALLNLTALALFVVYAADHALVFLLGWEISAVAAWLMVIWDYRSQKIRFAGFNYLVSTHVGLFILVAAFMLLYAESGVMDFASFGPILARPGRLRGVVFLLLGAAFGLKAAFFPFHSWLPRAHSAAPAHVSALMSGVIHKAGLFAFLRFLLLFGEPAEWMGWSVLAAGAASAFFGVLYTTVQRDLKRLLGYSSTENVGIAAIGLGVGCLGMTWKSPILVMAGFAGGLLHLMNHGIFKCLLFYAAGAIWRGTHTVDLERLGGLLRRLPVAAVTFLVGTAAISALPPLNGFVSEMLIYSGLLAEAIPSSVARAALTVVAALLAFVGGVSALATSRAFGVAFLGNPRDPHIRVQEKTPASMRGPMIALALLAVLFGLFPLLGLSLVRAPAALFVPTLPNAPVASSVVASVETIARVVAASTILACLLGAVLRRRARSSVTWGCGYTAGTARMQYTGSSFAASFARFFGSFLPESRREHLPRTIFPHEASHLTTHHADAVETRLYEVLGRGEEMIVKSSTRISEEPRYAFAAGLVALALLVGVIIEAAR